MNDHAAKSFGIMRSKLRTDFARIGDRTFAGYVVDETELARHFVVEILVDGSPMKLTRADAYHNELAIEGVGDGHYAFAFELPERVIDQASTVEARLANTGIAVGQPISLTAPADAAADPQPSTELNWLGGLRFDGWCIADDQSVPIVTAVIDGENVTQAQATRWANVGTADSPRLARRFDLHLPDRFADGQVRRVQFFLKSGDELRGSPATIVAFYDGLTHAIERLNAPETERLRAVQFDRLFPMTMPFSEYEAWSRRFTLAQDKGSDNRSIAIALIGPGDVETSATSLQENDSADWIIGALDNVTGYSDFNREQMLDFLADDGRDAEFVVFSHSGAAFAPDALRRIAAAFNEFPDAAAVYGDFDVQSEGGAKWPVALPAFDYERLLEQGYCSHLFALRPETVRQAVEAGAASLYRLFTFVLDHEPQPRARVAHVPGSLATLSTFYSESDCSLQAQATSEHLRARGIRASSATSDHSFSPATRVARAGPAATVTIVIPVRNRLELLQSCLRSIAPAMTDGDVDILIVDNGSDDPEFVKYLNSVRGDKVTVIAAPGPFNFAHLNNVAADRAKGDLLCLLNNDVKATDEQWLREMRSRIAAEDVGAVGALLLWPSGVVQHAGTVLGPSFAAAHAFCDRLHTDPGYTDLLRVAHECSAVTAACLLTRRRDYLDVGGMDELHFPVNFNDVDYCLRLRAKGKRIVLTPHARLYHFESASRGQDDSPEKAGRFSRELRNLRARWGEHLMADPYYSPILSLDAMPFSGLAWPPRVREARINHAPIAAGIPPGF
jgi:GT2 family glycosyltransferase